MTVTRPSSRSRGAVFWGGLVILVAGLVLAGLSVPAILVSIQRGQDLESYTRASVSAARIEGIGVEAVATGRLLAELSRSDAEDASQMQQVLVQGDDQVFNALKAESNARIDAEVEAHNRMVELANRLNRLVPPEATLR